MTSGTMEGGRRAYRPDVDGLRALAVLVIVSFHAWPQWVTGGFVGVDVFFVISGFLITRIIAEQRDQGEFSFREFYRRRARRILPAYFLVTAVTALAAFAVLLPNRLETFGYTLAASGVFLTNVYFIFDSGYFLPAAHDNLLLHLWSLAVEEQFYLLWPVVFVLLSKVGERGRALGVGLLGLASLTLAQWWILADQASLAFFLLPTRAWELLLGAGLALGLLGRPARRAFAEAAVVAGLILIGSATLAFDETTPFPGLTALVPCAGAALVIWGGLGSRTTAAAFLRSPAMVGLGLVSYSLYLWHWPVLTGARLLAQRPLNHVETLLLIGLSLGLAALTWRFVERPWRREGFAPRWRHLGYGAALLVVFVGAGAASVATGGLPGRLSPKALAHLDGVKDMNPSQDTCFIGRDLSRWPDAARCTQGGEARRAPEDYDLLIWGDSHGDAFAPGLVTWAEARNMRTRQLNKGACPSLLDVTVRSWRGEDATCPEFNRRILKEIATHPGLKLIVISARWPVYVNARPKYHLFPSRYVMEDIRTGEQLDQLETPLARTLDAIAATGTKAQVVVFGAIPDLPFVVPWCLAQTEHLGRSKDYCRSIPAEVPLKRVAGVDAAISAAIRERPFASAVFPSRHLCAGGRCATMEGDMLIYFDHNHMSATAARRLVPAWMDEAMAAP